VFLAAVVPAALALVVLALFVRAPAARARPVHGLRATVRSLDPRVWRLVLVAVVFALGNSSLAFVLLRAGRAGLAPGAVPLAYLAYNLVYAALAWPLGRLSDRVGRRPLLVAAYLVYAAAYALLAWNSGVVAAITALLVLGIHAALFDGTQRSLLADVTEPATRATAYGLYYAAVGAALLPASVVAGWLWDHASPSAAFGLSAALAAAAAVLLPLLVRESRRSHA
jgi:MFS family permease